MKHIRPALLLAALLTAVAAMAQSAAELMRGVSAKLSQAPSVEVQFTINGTDGPMEGSAVLSGAYFTLTTPVLRVWFDGHTQWTMLSSTQEVSITEPTADEVMESNPFAILRDYASRYSVRRLPDVAGRKRVELKPLQTTDTEIERAVIIIGADGWPVGAEVHFEGNRMLGAAVDHISAGAAKPQSAFRYNPALYPAAEIIDLR